MLYKESVSVSIIEILHKLFITEELKDFELVGGTSLSLQIGHRISYDIDLFCKSTFENKTIKECVLDIFSGHQISFDYEAKNTIIGSIDNIKIDFIRHNYPSVDETKTIEEIRLCSIKDIAAIKINAITENGTRIKDFIDLYNLLQIFTLEEILTFYKTKYTTGNELFALKSIAWFNDINLGSINQINFLNNKKISFEDLTTSLKSKCDSYIREKCIS